MAALEDAGSATGAGCRVGMLGGGQLGRMSILAGHRLGLRFRVYEPTRGSCAAAVADEAVTAPWSDTMALRRFAAELDAVTLEFENVPEAAARLLAGQVPVRPGPDVLATCQNRVREKRFLSTHRFACAPFEVVESAGALGPALERVGSPCVLKRAETGYDGKGQKRIENARSIGEAAALLGDGPCVLEKWIPFRRELSVIVARDAGGQVRTLPLVENIHRDHILHATLAPAPESHHLATDAAELACGIAEAFGLVGVLAVELFEDEGGALLVNELAPRPHNSGHFSIDACAHSQFALHCRAVAGLPLVEPAQRQPAVMVNLLGDLWEQAPPDWSALLTTPACHLHLYDKGAPRPGRKMGHFTVVDHSLEEAREKARGLFRTVGGEPGF